MALNSLDSEANFAPLPPLVKGGNTTREGIEAAYKLWQKGRAARLRELQTEALKNPIITSPLAGRPRF